MHAYPVLILIIARPWLLGSDVWCNSPYYPPSIGASYTCGVAKVPSTDAAIQGSKRTWPRGLYMDMWCTHTRILARSRVGTPSVGAGRCYHYTCSCCCCIMFEGAYKLHWAIGIFQWNSIIHNLVLEENILIFICFSRNIQWSRQCVCAANLEVCFLLWLAGNAPLLTTVLYLYALLLIHVFPFCTGLAQQLNTVQLSLVYRPYRMRYRLFLSVIVETELRVLFIFFFFEMCIKIVWRIKYNKTPKLVCTGLPKPLRRCRRRLLLGRVAAGCSCRAPERAMTMCATCRPCTLSDTFPPR